MPLLRRRRQQHQMNKPTASTVTPTTGATIAATRVPVLPCVVAEGVDWGGDVEEKVETLLVCELVEGEAEYGGLDTVVGA